MLRCGVGGFQKAGIPDILGVVNGAFFAIELKGDGGKASELQKRNIDLINEAGGIGFISYPNDYDEIVSLLDAESMKRRR